MSTTIEDLDFLKMISKHLPDMLWAKDINGKYLYANDSICKNLLMADPSEVIGQVDTFFAKREREKHIDNPKWHTFGELCFNSDVVVLENMKPMIFEEYGNIKGKLVYLEVHKAPLFDNKGNLIGTIGSGRNITAQKMLEIENERLAYFDQLTKLPNRQKIINDIEIKKPSGCAIFNIDGFKEINDFFGIEKGDIVLQKVADWFSTISQDVYRIDGDEFAILYYEEENIENVKFSVENILGLFEEESFHIEGETLHIRLTAGIGIGSKKLLTRTDIAVNYAKEQKLKISVYEENANIEQKYKKNIAIANSVRQALIHNRIICYYQAIKDLKTNEITKYETLVRMIDENDELIPPNEFLKISKRTKLYPHITLEVVKQACGFFENRKEDFSINISIDDIKEANVVQDIIKTIIKTKTATRIIFEILESEGIENYNEVVDFIVQVKALGAKIAIDDFGTGYSNFEHILKLNIDHIKIDGSLIYGINKSLKHKIIVETIVDFAKKIGASTIAEFVADEETYESVKSLGLDYSQGYYISKPKPKEEIS